MTDDRQKDSRKMRTEVKEVIRNMLSSGKQLTIANICEEAKCSRSFLYSSEMKEFIKEQQEKQKKEDWRVDIELQNSIYHTKLMASYIFLYSLLDQQEEFYKIAIEELKDKEKSFDAPIKFIAQILENETNPEKISDILEKFQASFSEIIPNWKGQLIKTLNSCLTLDMLKERHKEENDF